MVPLQRFARDIGAGLTWGRRRGLTDRANVEAGTYLCPFQFTTYACNSCKLFTNPVCWNPLQAVIGMAVGDGDWGCLSLPLLVMVVVGLVFVGLGR